MAHFTDPFATRQTHPRQVDTQSTFQVTKSQLFQYGPKERGSQMPASWPTPCIPFNLLFDVEVSDRDMDEMSLLGRPSSHPRHSYRRSLNRDDEQEGFPQPRALLLCHGNGDNMRYIPLVPHRLSASHSYSSRLLTTLELGPQEVTTEDVEAPMQLGCTWPMGRLPVEVFAIIMNFLPRDDWKALRLVNVEFEKLATETIFHTLVVPSDNKLYEMLTSRSIGGNILAAHSNPGTERRSLRDNVVDGAAENLDPSNGPNIFESFGMHVRRFGMTSEIDEKQLEQRLTKKLDVMNSTYHGEYQWPSTHYVRNLELTSLEQHAENLELLTAAFQHLTQVGQLALRLDNGLGWLNGPDKSIKSRIFNQRGPAFAHGEQYQSRSKTLQAQFWDMLCRSHRGFCPSSTSLNDTMLVQRPIDKDLKQLGIYLGTQDCNTTTWLLAPPNIELNDGSILNTTSGLSVIYATTRKISSFSSSNSMLKPAQLTGEQAERLLETGWAQKAFLRSFTLSVMDNPNTFKCVRSFEISRLSSNFLHRLNRHDFWNSLPALTSLTLLVSADWRRVVQTSTGSAELQNRRPSQALEEFFRLLDDQIRPRRNITDLHIGWAGGGEHAQGVFARNKNILPAPLLQSNKHLLRSDKTQCIHFNYVQRLKIVNCWFPPRMLIRLVQIHEKANANTPTLRELILESVSLSIDLDGLTQDQPHGIAPNIAAQMQPLIQPPANPFTQNAANLVALAGLFHVHHHPNNTTPVTHNQNIQGIAAGVATLPHVAQSNPIQPISNGFALDPVLGFSAGSWPTVLNLICPGRRLADFVPTNRDERVNAKLRVLELKSCGYVRLSPNVAGRQQDIEAQYFSRQQLFWLKTREQELDSVMMHSKDLRLGEIVQGIRLAELRVLKVVYQLEEGWEDTAAADDVVYDGLMPGGTGRVSGVMRMDPTAEAQLDREETYERLRGQDAKSSVGRDHMDDGEDLPDLKNDERIATNEASGDAYE